MKHQDFVNELTKIKAKDILLVGPLTTSLQIQELKRPSGIIFIDGGADFKKEMIWDQVPHFSIGDGDSLKSNQELDAKLDPSKDQTDLYHALRSVPLFIESLVCVGLSGGEKDQELAVLGECFHYIRENTHIRSIALSSCLELFQIGETTLSINGLFSIFSLEKISLMIKGDCEYPLNSPTEILPLSSRSFRNQAKGLVTISSDRPFFVFKG